MYRIPLIFTPQPEGGYTVTCPVLPELITDGDTLTEARANVEDAFAAVVELYAEQNRPCLRLLRKAFDEPRPSGSVTFC